MRLDLSLENKELYKGCEVRELDRGRLNLKTPRKLAVPIIKENLARIMREVPVEEQTIVLTGRMTMWVYLIALTFALRTFKWIYFDDGEEILIYP